MAPAYMVSRYVVAQHGDDFGFLLLATYRPADVAVSQHPLGTARRELLARGRCHELPLGLLSGAEVLEYLSLRFPENDFPLARRQCATALVQRARESLNRLSAGAKTI